MCLLIGNDAVILLLRLRQRPSSTLFPYTTLFRSVDFWAEWCGPCKQLGPVLEKAVSAAKGKVKLVKMDIDKHPAIPGQMGDRKSTRLNSSHANISYAVFCVKKKIQNRKLFHDLGI